MWLTLFYSCRTCAIYPIYYQLGVATYLYLYSKVGGLPRDSIVRSYYLLLALHISIIACTNHSLFGQFIVAKMIKNSLNRFFSGGGMHCLLPIRASYLIWRFIHKLWPCAPSLMSPFSTVASVRLVHGLSGLPLLGAAPIIHFSHDLLHSRPFNFCIIYCSKVI